MFRSFYFAEICKVLITCLHTLLKVSAAVNSVDSSLCSGLDKLVDKVWNGRVHLSRTHFTPAIVAPIRCLPWSKRLRSFTTLPRALWVPTPSWPPLMWPGTSLAIFFDFLPLNKIVPASLLWATRSSSLTLGWMALTGKDVHAFHLAPVGELYLHRILKMIPGEKTQPLLSGLHWVRRIDN